MGNCNKVVFQTEFPEEAGILDFESSLQFKNTFFELNAKITADSLLNDSDWIRIDSLVNILSNHMPDKEIEESTPSPVGDAAQEGLKEDERKTMHSRLRSTIKKTRSIDLTTPKPDIKIRFSLNIRENLKEKLKELIKSGSDFFVQDISKKSYKLCGLKSKLLCFVMCGSTNVPITNTLTLNDRGVFLFEQGKVGDKEVIYKNNIHFETLIEFMVMIACEIIPYYYLTCKKSIPEEENYLSILHRFREEIVEKLKGKIFGEKNSISEDEFLRLFDVDSQVKVLLILVFNF
jgi:hypothetical protein